MQILYTTSVMPTNPADNPQVFPHLSLGGYASTSQIPNGRLNNLFSNLSLKDLTDELSTYIGVMLYNNSASAVTGLELWLENPSETNVLQADFEFAVVVPQQDLSGNYYIERLNDRYSMPYVGDFYSANGEDEVLTLPDIAANRYLGLWIKRIPSKAKATTEYNNSITKTGDVYVQAELPKEDTVNIKLSWT